jgi:threonine dehydrogenase-like Zn-dependent dehydrogenase
MKSKAAVVVRPEEMEYMKFRIFETESHGILTKIELAGICGSDLHLWHGLVSTVKYPIILGHENIGIIQQLGRKIKTDASGSTLRIGDMITWLPGYSCEKCFYCRIMNEPLYCPDRTAYGRDLPPNMLGGGFAEYMYVRQGTGILKIPQSITSKAAIAASCAGTTLVQGMERVKVDFGDTIVVQGLGPLGLFGLALAIKGGALKTIGIDSSKRSARMKLAKKFGVDHILDIENTSPDERIKAVKNLTGGHGADVVIEATGVPEAVFEGVQMLAPLGKYLVVGQVKKGYRKIWLDPTIITTKSLRIIGSLGSKPNHQLKALRFIEKGDFPFEDMVTHELPLEESKKALEMAERSKEAIIVTIRP